MVDLTRIPDIDSLLLSLPSGCLAQVCHLLGLMAYAPEPAEVEGDEEGSDEGSDEEGIDEGDGEDGGEGVDEGEAEGLGGNKSGGEVDGDASGSGVLREGSGGDEGGDEGLSSPHRTARALASDAPWDAVLDRITDRLLSGRSGMSGWRALEATVRVAGEVPVGGGSRAAAMRRGLRKGVRRRRGVEEVEGGGEEVVATGMELGGRGAFTQRFGVQSRLAPEREEGLWRAPDEQLR